MDFRKFPGIQRDSEEWISLYKIRTIVERAINHLKINMRIARRRSRHHVATKADVFLTGIASQFTVVVAHRLSYPHLEYFVFNNYLFQYKKNCTHKKKTQLLFKNSSTVSCTFYMNRIIKKGQTYALSVCLSICQKITPITHDCQPSHPDLTVLFPDYFHKLIIKSYSPFFNIFSRDYIRYFFFICSYFFLGIHILPTGEGCLCSLFYQNISANVT